MLITQQPGSISNEILSQGDNWFVFHLLSAGDLNSVQAANAHFSRDLLSSLLNEPIPGHGIFWSSAGGKPYPLSVRVMSFEDMYEVRDPNYGQPAARTYAAQRVKASDPDGQGSDDPLTYRLDLAAETFREHPKFREIMDGKGALWIHLKDLVGEALGKDLPLSEDDIFTFVRHILNDTFGDGNWHAVPDPGHRNLKRVRIRLDRVTQAFQRSALHKSLQDSKKALWTDIGQFIKKAMPSELYQTSKFSTSDIRKNIYQLSQLTLDDLYGPNGWESHAGEGGSKETNYVILTEAGTKHENRHETPAGSE